MATESADPQEFLRKITKELVDISKNAIFVGGVKFLGDKSGSQILVAAYLVLGGALFAYINSYIQAASFSRWVRERFGFQPWLSKAIGYTIAIPLLFAAIMASDQTIAAIASAQSKP